MELSRFELCIGIFVVVVVTDVTHTRPLFFFPLHFQLLLPAKKVFLLFHQFLFFPLSSSPLLRHPPSLLHLPVHLVMHVPAPAQLPIYVLAPVPATVQLAY